MLRLGACSILTLTCWVTLASAVDKNSGPVAVVNGSPLSKADLEQEVVKILPRTTSMHGSVSDEKMSKIRAEALQKLIDIELKYQDARAKGMKITDDDIEAEIKARSTKFKSEKEFKAAVDDAGFDKKGFARFVERGLLSDRIRKAEIEDKITITDAGVKEFYVKNSSKYSKPEEFRASHILFKVQPSASEADRATIRKRADAVLKQIKDGGNFADIAAEESDDLSRIKGGDIGYFHAGQTLSEFENILVKLKVGQVSDIIETMYGYHIIQLTGRKAPRQIPFEELQMKIKKDLVESEKARLLDKWMSALKAKAVISYPGAK